MILTSKMRMWILFSLLGLLSANLFPAQAITTDPSRLFSDGVYLNPNTGRFWTMDSYAGNNSDPLSLHKYTYCENDPVNGVDPSGQMTLAEVQAVGTKILAFVTYNSVRFGPRVTVMVYEAVTGNAVILGGGTVVGASAAISKIPGGLGTWARLGQALKGSVLGPYRAVANVLQRSGRDAHHINPTAIFPNIPRETGAAIDLARGATVDGSRTAIVAEHNAFHVVMRRFLRPYQVGGELFLQRPTNQQVRNAMREAYEATGRFLDDQIDEIMEFAEKEQRVHGYFDGPGGLPPRVPDLN